MAFAETQTAYRFESDYWRLVEATLVGVFQIEKNAARQEIDRLISAQAEAPADERLLSFHTEPLSVAAAVLHRTASDDDARRYIALARDYGWAAEPSERLNRGSFAY